MMQNLPADCRLIQKEIVAQCCDSQYCWVLDILWLWWLHCSDVTVINAGVSRPQRLLDSWCVITGWNRGISGLELGRSTEYKKNTPPWNSKWRKTKKQKNTKWKLFISSQKKTEGLIWFSHNIHVRHQFTFCHPMICESPCWARWLCSVLIQCSDLHLFICFHLDSAFVFFPSSTSEEGAT